ncbi:MAG: ArsR/SmtB family transcription factor [Parasphingopyxis sp.]|nr:metalloregulator ArsR/SmtB family transcription factor [Sphingomonadales bacterium]
MDRFDALADPTRREIVAMLAERERAAGEIAEAFPVTPPAISQHLKVLRENGLVRVEKRGQQRIYSLDPEGLAAMEGWISDMRTIWNARLDRLAAMLDQED